MWKALLNGRFLGHPIHPMLIHFPTALFTVAFLFDVVGLLSGIPELFNSSFYVLIPGLAAGLLAALFGLIDLIKLVSKPELFTKAGIHALLQFTVMTIFGVVGGLKYGTYPQVEPPGIWLMAAMGFGITIMLIGNYLGGDLVFTHKVGIDEGWIRIKRT